MNINLLLINIKRSKKLFHIMLLFSLSLVFACDNKSNKGKKVVKQEQKETANFDMALEAPNSLSEEEERSGWKLLFDGKTTRGWRGVNKENFPEKGWIIENGMITVFASSSKSERGGHILTEGTYKNFELSLEFKVEKGGNSGIFYLVQETPWQGMEYQILDDDKHPDAKKGKNGNRTVASLYDLIPPKNKKVNPVGEWNLARIVVRGNDIEHWLNGNKVLEYEYGSKEFKETIAESKFKGRENFGKANKGHILLQDHGDKVSFRNIKIREL